MVGRKGAINSLCDAAAYEQVCSAKLCMPKLWRENVLPGNNKKNPALPPGFFYCKML
jgi:hypothetical protein